MLVASATLALMPSSIVLLEASEDAKVTPLPAGHANPLLHLISKHGPGNFTGRDGQFQRIKKQNSGNRNPKKGIFRQKK